MDIAIKPYSCLARVTNVTVELEHKPWRFAGQHSDEIWAFWHERKRSQPHLYNGQVHVMTSWRVVDGNSHSSTFVGRLARVNFASFLYWKHFATDPQEAVDFSGAAAILCRDRALLMVVSGAHTIRPGTLEFPSGFVDVSDFEGDMLNFNRHVEREAAEELAITTEQLSKSKQYLVSAADRVVQVLAPFTIETTGDEFIKMWRWRSANLRSEISDVVAIYHASELADFSVQAHVNAAVAYLLASS
jgi:8-oxo-dGTP pyrophosphatase MutT (NUDIX family)